ncbi:MAG: ATP-binding protein [Candidatus Levyibacteriota bacterium]
MAERRTASSLGTRILGGVLGVVLVVWLGIAVYAYIDARHEVNELLDAHLAQSASLIVAQLGHGLEEIELEHAPALDRSNRRVAFQVWEEGRTLRLHSANSPPVRLTSKEQGFSDVRIDGRGWRVFSGWDVRRRFLVQVGERDETRREIAAGVARNLLVPLAPALPLLALFTWLSIRGGLAPLRSLGRQVQERRPSNLSPLPTEDIPRDVVPLVRSLNGLFERVAHSIERERRFTADAAHELRTPLAALKTQAQVASGTGDDAVRQRALDAVIAGCDRMAHLVGQLLTLARIDSARSSELPQALELRALSVQAIADMAPAALAAGVELQLADGPVAPLVGYPGLLTILVRNLLDNAVRYSRPGTQVTVEISDGGHPCLSITDQGPGIPPEERDKVGQRFYRVLGTGQEGSGLGLSIALRIAEMHRGSLHLGEGPGGVGLRVTAEFNRDGPAV